MTEAEWYGSDDAGSMLDFLWQQLRLARAQSDSRESRQTHAAVVGNDVTRALHRFYLASCRRIWKLLPQEGSRRGVELAEQFLAGAATAEEVYQYNSYTEAAAFCIDYEGDPESIARWVSEVRALPAFELRSALHPAETADAVEPRELLKRAAYFADYAMMYPTLRPPGPPGGSYRPFLSAELLRQHVEYPGNLRPGGG